MSTALFLLAGLVLVAALFVVVGRAGGGVPDLEQASTVMADRMILDEAGRRAAETQNREMMAAVEEGRAVLAECVESQGFANDDSARFIDEDRWLNWLVGFTERWKEA